jgi:hypothetical protein
MEAILRAIGTGTSQAIRGAAAQPKSGAKMMQKV